MNEQREDRFDRALQALLAGGADDAAEFKEELMICKMLRDLPHLERRTMLTTTSMKAVTPMILVAEPERMLAFLAVAFGATVSGGEARLGNAILKIAVGAMPGSFHYFVDDVDAAYERAIAAGATVMMGSVGEPADRPYGERSAFIQDPFGNQWFLGKSLHAGGQQAGELAPHLNPSSGRGQIAFLETAFGGKVAAVHEHEGKVMHAAVLVGDAMVEMGESGRLPMALSLAVDDPEAARRQALAAGATEGPEGCVVDPFGNRWYLERSL